MFRRGSLGAPESGGSSLFPHPFLGTFLTGLVTSDSAKEDSLRWASLGVGQWGPGSCGPTLSPAPSANILS